MSAAHAPRRVLLVEDSPDDALLIELRLRRVWPELYVSRVETPEALQSALATDAWDIVLSDHVLPRMGSGDVVAAAVASGVPCIVVSGRIGEEADVSALHAGASDFVGKDQLQRLDTAIVRALREAEAERARAATEAALRESEERYALAAAGSNDGLWDWQIATDTVFVSERWNTMLGLTPVHRTFRGMGTWYDRIHPDDAAHVRGEVERHLGGASASLEVEYRARHETLGWRWMHLRGLAVRDAGGNATRMAGSVTDITERKNVEAQLAHGALHDPLTGLPNRVLFHDRLAHALERRARQAGPAAVLLIDLDRFKVINDSLGHPVGDRVLVTVAQRLEACLRPGDTVARLGGDEFAMLLEGLHAPAEATHVADRLQETLRTPIDIGGREVYTSASVGIAMTKPGTTPAEVLRDADMAMYRAKALGKARSALFDDAMHARAMVLLQLESDLRRAIERGELEVHYQPVVRLRDGSLRGLEALLRWNHPRRGSIAPERFVPLAEETGLIVPIGAWALEQAARQAAIWIDRGVLPLDAAVAVNVSGRQLAHADLTDVVEGILKRTHLAPEHLQLEITETALIENNGHAAASLARLRALSVRLSLDDFGTGYSSLAYLQRFPVDCIKIDRSFVSRLEETPRFVAGLISLATHLGMETVAEGVETRAQAQRLVALNCGSAQGWLYAEALPADRLEAVLAKGFTSLGVREEVG